MQHSALMSFFDIKKLFKLSFKQFLVGWEMGFEPTIFGTTIRRFNQLSYTHHIGASYWIRTSGLLLRRQLLYPAELKAHVERVMGIEPT